jgi:hypothetical protein
MERLARVEKDVDMDEILKNCKRLDLIEGASDVEILTETISRTKIHSTKSGAMGKSRWLSDLVDEDGKQGRVNVEQITLEHFNELGWKV